MALDLFDDIQQRGFLNSPAISGAIKQFKKAHTQSIVSALPALRTADCYELKQSVMGLVVTLMREKPSTLHPLYEHIALPSDRVWVEYDAVAFNTMRHNAGLLPNVQPEPTRLGLFFSGKAHDQSSPISIRIFTLDQGHSTLTDSSFEFRGNRPHNWPVNQIRNVVGQSGMNPVDAPRLCAWGSYASTWQTDPVEAPYMRKLLDIGNMFYEQHVHPFAATVPLSGGIGSLPFAMAILNILDNKPIMNIASQPRNSTFQSSVGVTKPFSITYNSVGLNVSVPTAINRINKRVANRKPPMQHVVRGHWTYRRNTYDPNCVHVWIDTGKNTQQNCSKCNGLRWFRIASLRGDIRYGKKITTHTVVR